MLILLSRSENGGIGYPMCTVHRPKIFWQIDPLPKGVQWCKSQENRWFWVTAIFCGIQIQPVKVKLKVKLHLDYFEGFKLNLKCLMFKKDQNVEVQVFFTINKKSTIFGRFYSNQGQDKPWKFEENWTKIVDFLLMLLNPKF